MKARVVLLAGALGVSLALASCGVKTGLDQPAPMFGKARQNYLAEQERLKAEEAARAASSPPSALPPPAAPSQPIGRTPIQPPALPAPPPPAPN